MRNGAAALSAVVPHWNRRDLLASLLPMLERQTASLHERIIVDNGSIDGSREDAVRLGARVISLKNNVGFAGAVNVGVRLAETEWVAVLNNDVVLEAGYLSLLHEACLQSGARLASGRLFTADSGSRTLDGTWDLLSRGACAWRAGQGKPDSPEWNVRRSVRLVPFTAVLVHRATFLELGGLDEEYGSYLEDVDFCLRAALRGFEAIYVPAARGVHIGSSTLGAWSPGVVRALSRNQMLLIGKHYPPELRRKFRRATVAGQLLWGILAVRHGALLPWLQGKLDGWSVSRRAAPPASDRTAAHLESILRETEQEIRQLQQRCGFDWYWRAYFRWCGN